MHTLLDGDAGRLRATEADIPETTPTHKANGTSIDWPANTRAKTSSQDVLRLGQDWRGGHKCLHAPYQVLTFNTSSTS